MNPRKTIKRSLKSVREEEDCLTFNGVMIAIAIATCGICGSLVILAWLIGGF